MTDVLDQLSPTAGYYVPSPTCAKFIRATRHGPLDEMRVLILRGARGEGKTSGGLWACMALAERLAVESPEILPLRVGVVRDTWTNLERTTLVSFEENARLGLELEFLNGRREARVACAGTDFVHFWFFGLDRPDDADKLQGFACGILWLEEVAPAARVASGVPASVVGIGRPQAIGVTPTSPVTVVAEDPGDPAGTVTTALAWGTPPTVPLFFLRRLNLPATIGAGVILTFPRGLAIAVSNSIVHWNITATGVMDVHHVIDE